MPQIITVCFDKSPYESKGYFFNCFDDVGIGDKVVVMNSFGLAIGTVQSFETEVPSAISKKYPELAEVVCRIDMTAYNTRQAIKEQKKQLKAQMEKRLKKLQDEAIFAMYAEKDPEMKKLYDAYSEILKGE